MQEVDKYDKLKHTKKQEVDKYDKLKHAKEARSRQLFDKV